MSLSVASAAEWGVTSWRETRAKVAWSLTWCSASPSWVSEPCSSAIFCLRASCQWVWTHITQAHTHPCSHTHTVYLIQWMFNGAEQPFILLCCLCLGQRGVSYCMCVYCVSVCARLWMYVLHQTDFKGSETEPEILFLSVCPPFISAAALSSCLFSLQLRFSPLPISHRKISLLLSSTCRPSSHSPSKISATSLLDIVCSLSAVLLVHCLDTWWTEAVCASNLVSALSLLLFALLLVAWAFASVWRLSYGPYADPNAVAWRAPLQTCNYVSQQCISTLGSSVFEL